MERLLLDQVEWRVKLPTAYGFLHMLTQALAGRLCPSAIALSAYLAELSLLDYGMLDFPPSLVATAALAVGAAWHGGGGNNCAERAAFDALEQITGYTLTDLGACAAQLLHLHQCAALANAVPAYQPLAFVREKYAQDHWLSISRQEPQDAAALAAASLGLPAAIQQQLQQHIGAAQQQQLTHGAGMQIPMHAEHW